MTIKKLLGQKFYFQMDTLERKNHHTISFPKVSLAIEVHDVVAE